MSLTGAPNGGELSLETTAEAENRLQGNVIAAPLSDQELSEKYDVAPSQSTEKASDAKVEAELKDVAVLRAEVQRLGTELNTMPNGEEFNKKQKDFFSKKEELVAITEKPHMDAFLVEAREAAGRITDVSYSALKNRLKGHIIGRDAFDDGRGHDGKGAAGYGIAIMESGELSSTEKLELIKDVYSGMSGYSGNFGERIINGYKKDLEARVIKSNA